ncbi:MAG: DUF2281 domain-containing protein [Anaerolineae bacterium]|nr:DUF2281 domain-containing protein [Anaerolineae bacterium]
MTQQYTQLEERFRALPPEAQKQMLEFLTFLEQRYRVVQPPRPKKPLRAYAFVGLWRGREEMDDSNRWVRHLRQQEWGK